MRHKILWCNLKLYEGVDYNTHLKEKYEMKLNKLTVTPPARGAGASTPMLGISENGQIRMNLSAVSELLKGVANKEGVTPSYDSVHELFMDFNEDTRTLAISLNHKTFSDKAGEGLPCKINIDKTDKTKIRQLSMGGSGICAAIGYDFKKSGNQAFKLAVNGKPGVLHSVTIPASLVAKPKKVRVEKTKEAEKVTESAPIVDVIE